MESYPLIRAAMQYVGGGIHVSSLVQGEAAIWWEISATHEITKPLSAPCVSSFHFFN